MGIDGRPDPKQAGLLPRLVAALFVHIGADLKHVYTVEASMLQIYNENIDCLLGMAWQILPAASSNAYASLLLA
jgi:hypothetical protein